MYKCACVYSTHTSTHNVANPIQPKSISYANTRAQHYCVLGWCWSVYECAGIQSHNCNREISVPRSVTVRWRAFELIFELVKMRCALYGFNCMAIRALHTHTLFEVVTLNWLVQHYVCIINKQFCKHLRINYIVAQHTKCVWGAHFTNQNPKYGLWFYTEWAMADESIKPATGVGVGLGDLNVLHTHTDNGRNDEIENTNPNNEIMLKFYHSSIRGPITSLCRGDLQIVYNPSKSLHKLHIFLKASVCIAGKCIY